MACGEALETCIYLRGLLLSFLHGEMVPNDLASELIPLHLFTDCKSLYDHLHKDGVPKPPSERRLALDLASIRRDLRGEAKGQWRKDHPGEEVRPDRPQRPPLHWLPTEWQLSDVLTKRMSPAKWWALMTGSLKVPLQLWNQQKIGGDLKPVLMS